MTIKLIVPFVFLALFLTACGASVEAEEVDTVATAISEVSTLTATAEPTRTAAPTRDFDNNPPAGAEREFITDFSQHSVSYREIQSGGPSKDGIPAVDFPEFSRSLGAQSISNP